MPDFSDLSALAIAGIIVFSVMEAIKVVVNYARITYMRKVNGGDPVEHLMSNIRAINARLDKIEKDIKKIDKDIKVRRAK